MPVARIVVVGVGLRQRLAMVPISAGLKHRSAGVLEGNVTPTLKRMRDLAVIIAAPGRLEPAPDVDPVLAPVGHGGSLNPIRLDVGTGGLHGMQVPRGPVDRDGLRRNPGPIILVAVIGVPSPPQALGKRRHRVLGGLRGYGAPAQPHEPSGDQS